MHCGDELESLHTNHIKENPCEIVKSFFERQIEFLSQYGEQQVILDPGIGFNKSMKSNFELLNNINEYRVNNLPVLIGISRKSMIYKTLKTTPQEALNGTTVLNTIALIKMFKSLKLSSERLRSNTVAFVASIITSTYGSICLRSTSLCNSS